VIFPIFNRLPCTWQTFPESCVKLYESNQRRIGSRYALSHELSGGIEVEHFCLLTYYNFTPTHYWSTRFPTEMCRRTQNGLFSQTLPKSILSKRNIWKVTLRQDLPITYIAFWLSCVDNVLKAYVFWNRNIKNHWNITTL
jgi:hypothetical protein